MIAVPALFSSAAFSQYVKTQNHQQRIDMEKVFFPSLCALALIFTAMLNASAADEIVQTQSALVFPKELVKPSKSTAKKLTFPTLTCLGEGTPAFKCEKIETIAYMFLPTAPTNKMVLISHGSQGIDERHFDYAESLIKSGFAALVMDHWTARGIGKAHHDFLAAAAKGGRGSSMATDAIMSIAYVKKTYPEFTKFGYIGESMGGGSAMILDRSSIYKMVERETGIISSEPSAIVALYAGCTYREYNFGTKKIPFLFITGEKDGNTPAAQCEKYSEWMNQRGGKFKIIILPGEEHDFDAMYSREFFSNAQHYSDCSVYVDKDTITWEKTGETVPRTPTALNDGYKRCLKRGTYSGYTKDRFVAVPYWLEHFKNNL
jgi:dienelactone hydrolase